MELWYKQSGLRSNGNEGSLHSSQISRTGALQSDAVLCDTQDTPFFCEKGLTDRANMHVENI